MRRMAKTLEFPDDIRPDFPGFSPAAFTFLAGLAKNNDRAWFTARKDVYDSEIRFPMECLLGEFAASPRVPDFPVQGDPKRGMFRVHRDVRFAKDKSPYKTHAGAVLTRSGGKGDPGIVYIHIEPGACFLSAGFYALDKDFLGAWRARIAREPGAFLDLVAPFADPDGTYFLRHRGALKTMPRGFQEHADSPAAEYLKWKHYLVSRNIPDALAQGPGLVAAIRELVDVAGPFLDYGWDVYETAFEDDPRRHMRSDRNA